MKKKQNILVTGGGGYIGSHTCKALYKSGFTPVVYDNFSLGHKYAVKWGEYIEGDIRDKKKLTYALKHYRPHAVMHFAANSLVGESFVSPEKYYNNNVYGAINLLETMCDNGIKHLVFSSTCATYGHPQTIPIDEKHCQKPISPYGKSKLMIEHILEDFEKAYGITYSSLRYFNAAGADIDGEIGEDHVTESHLIPLVLQSAIIKGPINIFGNDYDTKDGTAVRDYIHVTDLADAHIKSLQWITDNNKSLKINLGVGTGYSVLEVIKAAEKYCDINLDINHVERREGDPPVLIADNTLSKTLLNWHPQYSDIATIIKSAWSWHQQQHK
jgi:UDP-arabinose 4-epimerase